MRTIGLLSMFVAISACQARYSLSEFQVCSSTSGAVVYRNSYHTSEWVFDRGVMFIQKVDKYEGILERAEYGNFIWDVDTYECSDSTFKCLQAERFAFVAAKGPRSVGDHYVRNGLRFKVEACEGTDCAKARIRADCDAFIDSRCVIVPNGLPIGSNPSMTTYFVDQRNRGVISLGVIYDHSTGADGSAVAIEYRLVGACGILAN